MLTLGTRAQLGIGIAIQLIDQFSGTATKVNAQMKALQKNNQSLVTQGMRDYRNNSLAIAGGAAAITYGLMQAAKDGADFQHKINQTFIVGQDQIGKTRAQLTAWAENFSKDFTKTPDEVAGAMFENVKAGITSGLEDITRYQVAVAVATDEALEGQQGVAFGLLGIMNSMNISAEKQYNMAGKMVSGISRVSNAVTAAANSSMASVYDINEAMQYFSNTAYTMNLSLEESLALVAKLSQANIRGTTAGTALNNMLVHLSNSVGPFMNKQQAKAWGMVGLNPQTISSLLNAGQAYKALAMVETSSRRLQRNDRQVVLNRLLNIRGEKGLINAFVDADPNKTLEALRSQIMQGIQGDVVMQQAKMMMADTASEMKLFHNALFRLKNALLRAGEPAIRFIIRLGTGLMNTFGWILDTNVGKVLAGVIVIATPLIGILFAFRAAILTATIALNAMTRGVGFSELLGAGMGMLGTNVLGRGLMGAKGLARAPKGGITLGGKFFKGGSFLPGGARIGAGVLSGAITGTSAVSALGLAGKTTSMLGKIGPWVARIGSFGLKWLPVIGMIWTGVEVLKAILDVNSDMLSEEHKKDPKLSWDKDLLRALFGSRYVGPQSMQGFSQNYFGPEKYQPQLSQNLQINIDGVKDQQRKLQGVLDSAYTHQIQVNLLH